MESETNSFRVDFPDFSCSILQKLNQQRQLGQLCDITVVIQGRHYRAHRAVLAASSPYFCDQVLLKNSMRVVLPDVMHHCVFEGLLQSCYTGSLQLPAGEVVGYLTAASFLQMWHVVDKCTELLGGQRSCSGSDRLSPGDREDDSASEGLEAEPHGEFLLDPKDVGGDADQPTENGSPATSPEQGGGEDGEGAGVVGGPGFQYASRPAYIQPSIMSHRRWIQVKAERLEQDGCQGFSGAGDPDGVDDPDAGDLNQASPAFGADLEEKLGGRQEEPLDFYGASMEEFSADQAGGPLDVDALEDDADGDVGGGGGSGVDDGVDPSSGLHGEASHQGLGSVYKLYPCQCGKSFTHKSQRDRHMSMHLGLRPYGCAVCGKRFKMKHHLVGHVKIHTGIKPYECSVCGKRFMWRDSFNRHVSSCTRAQQARRAASEQPNQIC